MKRLLRWVRRRGNVNLTGNAHSAEVNGKALPPEPVLSTQGAMLTISVRSTRRGCIGCHLRRPYPKPIEYRGTQLLPNSKKLST
jgi:hypothetical protein